MTGHNGARFRNVAAICRPLVAARWLAAAALTVALACGRGPPQPALLTTDDPTFLGNSFPGTNDDSVPHSVMALAVSPDGYAIMGSYWVEENHDARLFDPNTGAVLGPYTQTRNHLGIYGVAADSTYIYYVTGDGQLWRSARSIWNDPANNTRTDNGSTTGIRPLIVDPGGNRLMGLAECDNELFVADPDGPLGSNGQVSPDSTRIKVVPLSLSRVTASWSVPRARAIACDKEGDIWVLQQGVSGGPRPDVERFTPRGTLLSSFSFAPGIYPEGLAADPNKDRLLVPDNGPDQNFKWFDYSGTQTGQIGVTGGYMAGPHPGLIGPNRFVGPRAAAIDPNGNVFTAESANPGVGQQGWASLGPAAIFTKFSPSGSVVWRDYGLDWGTVGQPTRDGSRFFDNDFEYARDSGGNYQPYAYTYDFTDRTDPRVNGVKAVNGTTVYERDLDGHRYLFTEDNPTTNTAYVYEQQPGSEIFKPVVHFKNNTDIITNGNDVNVSTNPLLIDHNGVNDWWMTDGGDVWTVGGSQVWVYRLQGFAADGTPQYDFHHISTYPLPPQLTQSTRRIEVYGNNVYVSGFSNSDPNPSHDWDGWKSSGRHILKFTSLPTSSGWPAPAWEHDWSYGVGGAGSSGFTAAPFSSGYPISWASDGAYVGVAWSRDPKTNSGEIFTLNNSNGTLARTYSPPVSGWGHLGWLDMARSITARNGWIWAEDDGQIKIYGLCPTGRCT